MGLNVLYTCGILLSNAPFIAVGVILAHYVWRRAEWRRGKRLGRKRLGYYPSAVALGMVLQFVEVFYRPSVENVLETRQEEVMEEDDEGDPDAPAKELSRQLKRIRKGEPVERLVVRV